MERFNQPPPSKKIIAARGNTLTLRGPAGPPQGHTGPPHLLHSPPVDFEPSLHGEKRRAERRGGSHFPTCSRLPFRRRWACCPGSCCQRACRKEHGQGACIHPPDAWERCELLTRVGSALGLCQGERGPSFEVRRCGGRSTYFWLARSMKWGTVLISGSSLKGYATWQQELGVTAAARPDTAKTSRGRRRSVCSLLRPMVAGGGVGITSSFDRRWLRRMADSPDCSGGENCWWGGNRGVMSGYSQGAVALRPIIAVQPRGCQSPALAF